MLLNMHCGGAGQGTRVRSRVARDIVGPGRRGMSEPLPRHAARLAFQSFSSPPLSRCLLVTCPRCRLVANETSNVDNAHVRSKQTDARVYSERADQFGREHRPHAMRDSVHKRLSESRNHSSNASRENPFASDG